MAKQAIRLANELPEGSSEIRPTHEDIAALAYTHWQEERCPEGTHEENWLRAEQELTPDRNSAVWTQRT